MENHFAPPPCKMTVDRLIALSIMLGGCALFLSPVVIELIHWAR